MVARNSKVIETPEITALLASIRKAIQSTDVPDDAAQAAIDGVAETMRRARAILDAVGDDAALYGLLREFVKLRLARQMMELAAMHSDAVRERIFTALEGAVEVAAQTAVPVLLAVLRDALLGLSGGSRHE